MDANLESSGPLVIPARKQKSDVTRCAQPVVDADIWGSFATTRLL